METVKAYVNEVIIPAGESVGRSIRRTLTLDKQSWSLLNEERLSSSEQSTEGEEHEEGDREPQAKTISAGDRELMVHPLGYALASNVLLKPLVSDARGMAICGASCLSLGAELSYLYEDGEKDTYSKGLVFLKEGKLEVFDVKKSSMTTTIRNGARKTLRSAAAAGNRLSARFSRLSSNRSSFNSYSGSVLELQHEENEPIEKFEDEFDKAASLNISRLFAINYETRANVFELVFLTPTGAEDTLEEPTLDFKKTSINLRCASEGQAEQWIKHILMAVQDQAMYTDMVEEHLRNKGPSNCENLLRLSLDLWTLCKGPKHYEVARAQERLANFLEEQGDRESEAAFWADHSNEIKDSFKTERESTEPKTVLEDIMSDIHTNGV